MAKTVILSESRGLFRRWANQFVSADPENHGIVVAGNIPRNSSYERKLRFINRYYARAANLAGEGGRLVISLGHGGASETNASIGMVDLLPNRALRVGLDEIRYYGSETVEGDNAALEREPSARTCSRLNRYDFDESTRRPEPPEADSITFMNCIGARSARSRGNFRQTFSRIGELIRHERLNEVVFLTCRVGNATDFIDRMSRIWRISIVAYEKQVAANRDDEVNPFYLYLVDEEHRKYRDQIPTRFTYESRPET